MPLRLPARPVLYRRTLILLVHIALIPLAYLAAFGLRFDFQIPPQEFAHFQTTVWYLLGIRLIVFWAGGLYRGYWKHVGLRDLVDLGLAVTRSEEHTSELQSQSHLVCCLLLEKNAERQWYRYAPSYVSLAYHLLDGFPFIQERPSGDLQERVLIRVHD